MVDILLATYNGSSFIAEQIDSILSQTYGDWRLIVHDDGSDDGTVDIVKSYSTRDDRILLVEDGISFHNPGANFLHLLGFSTAPFAMFCDQDDIWNTDKVERMLAIISQKEQDIPHAVYSNAAVWSPEEGECGPATLYFAKRLQDFLFLNSGVQGASSIFNSETVRLMQCYIGSVSMHDHLLQLICSAFGEVDVVDESLMLYRAHRGKVTGKTRTRVWSHSVIFHNARKPVIDAKHFETVKAFREVYSDRLDGKTAAILDDYLRMPEMSFGNKILTVLREGFSLYGSRWKLIVKILLRPYITR